MNKKTTFSRRLVGLLASRKFFWAVLVLFVLQAAWIALSGRYPMAFDEDFHLGIIRLYAHHISPFWSSQPENADIYGAVARDPSYLYQYLMSFPYRLISLFTHDQTIIVIILRFINIGLFAWGLVLYRMLLLKTRVHRAIAHLCILLFILLPIVPLLAAQINYDNLLLPIIAISLLLSIRFDFNMTNKKVIDVKTLIQLIIVCLLACLVKYAFLPILIAIAGFILFRSWQNRKITNGFWVGLSTSWHAISLWGQISLITGLIVAAGLFTQRIGYNVVNYHTPAPDCSKILTVEQCREYGPWIRDYNFKLYKGSVSRNPINYTSNWFYGMWLRTLFTLGGPETTFQTRGPLLIPGIGSKIFGFLGIAAMLVSGKKAFKRYNSSVLGLFFAVTSTYVAFLWLDGFMAYLRTGQPVAINGRYLLPIVPLILVFVAASLAQITKRLPKLQLALALLPVICLMWGGGVLTFILRSNDIWYWNNGSVRSANHIVQKIAGPVTPGYTTPTQFLR